jgi:hypothetical protein
MRKKLPSLVALCTVVYLVMLLLSCQSKSGDKTGASAVPSTSLTKPFPSLLEGHWVMTEYIDDIIKTKSPFRSSEKLGGLVAMIITLNNVEGDSLEVGANLGNHEGGRFTLYMRPGKTTSSFKTDMGDFADFENEGNFSELAYETANGDTSLFLYNYDRNQKQVGRRRFTRVHCAECGGSLEDGIQKVVRKHLIAGSYTVVESPEKRESAIVRFEETGSMTGISDFSQYDLLTDFVADDYPIDRIYFRSESSGDEPWLTFDIAGDTLNLYRTIQSEEGEIPGALLYKLVRKR